MDIEPPVANNATGIWEMLRLLGLRASRGSIAHASFTTFHNNAEARACASWLVETCRYKKKAEEKHPNSTLDAPYMSYTELAHAGLLQTPARLD